MKIKKIIVITLILACFTFMVVSCTSKKILKADSSGNAGWLMTLAIQNNNYDRFNELFSEGRENSLSIEEFNKLKSLTTAGTDFKHYELLTFTNGEMFLIRLTPEKVNGEFKIEDVIRVASEMKPLFIGHK